MSITPFDNLNTVPEVLSDFVDAFAGGNQVGSKGPAHVVYAADHATSPHVGGESPGEIVAIPPDPLSFIWVKDEFVLAASHEEAIQKFLERRGDGDGPIFSVFEDKP